MYFVGCLLGIPTWRFYESKAKYAEKEAPEKSQGSFRYLINPLTKEAYSLGKTTSTYLGDHCLVYRLWGSYYDNVMGMDGELLLPEDTFLAHGNTMKYRSKSWPASTLWENIHLFVHEVPRFRGQIASCLLSHIFAPALRPSTFFDGVGTTRI